MTHFINNVSRRKGHPSHGLNLELTTGKNCDFLVVDLSGYTASEFDRTFVITKEPVVINQVNSLHDRAKNNELESSNPAWKFIEAGFRVWSFPVHFEGRQYGWRQLVEITEDNKNHELLGYKELTIDAFSAGGKYEHGFPVK